MKTLSYPCILGRAIPCTALWIVYLTRAVNWRRRVKALWGE
jgi:hypothetical protein